MIRSIHWASITVLFLIWNLPLNVIIFFSFLVQIFSNYTFYIFCLIDTYHSQIVEPFELLSCHLRTVIH
jgi:hypothetical protein